MVITHPARPRLTVTALVLFTASTGAIDAVSYLGLDRVFTGNMTGNVLFLGFALLGVEGIPFLNNAIALLGFVAGVVVASRLVGRGHAPGPLPFGSRLVLGLGAVLVAGAAVLSALVPELPEGLLLVVTAGLAFAMGGQATAVRPVGNSEITTIVVTSTIANLSRDSRLAGGRSQPWVQRLLAVAAMGAGAAVGAGAVLHLSTAAALALALVLYTLATTLLLRATRPHSPK